MFKRILRPVAVLLIAVGFISGAGAESPEAMSVAVLETHYSACANDFDGYMQSIQRCVGATFEEQDDYLNYLWGALKEKLQAREETPEVFASLLDEQRKWLEYRDMSCRFYYDMDGTIWRTFATDCRFDVVQGRLKVLEDFYATLLGMEL